MNLPWADLRADLAEVPSDLLSRPLTLEGLIPFRARTAPAHPVAATPTPVIEPRERERFFAEQLVERGCWRWGKCVVSWVAGQVRGVKPKEEP